VFSFSTVKPQKTYLILFMKTCEGINEYMLPARMYLVSNKYILYNFV